MPRSPRGTPLGSGYVLQSVLGRGLAGTVWQGTSPGGLPVAVKVLDPRLAADPVVADRFARQRRSLADVHSPHLARLLDVVHDGTSLALVSELVPGLNLRDYLHQRGPLAPARALDLAGQVLLGLSAIHQAGLIHHDLTPENVLIDQADPEAPRAVVTDAWLVHGLGPGAYTVLGPSAYRAPEQGPERPETVTSDLYATGALLVEMLTGAPPRPPPPGSAASLRPVIPGLPPGFAGVISSMLAPDPQERPPSAAAAGDQLQQLLRRVEPLPSQPPADPAVPVPAARDAITEPIAASVTQPLTDPLPTAAGWPPVRGALVRQPPRRRHATVGLMVALLAAIALVLAIWRPLASPDRAGRSAAAAVPASSPGPSVLDRTAGPATPAAQPSGASAAWGPVRGIASAFPGVVPASPSGRGREGQLCDTAPAASDFSTGKIRCIYPDGQVVSLLSYASRNDRDRRAGQVRADPGTRTAGGWRTGSGAQQRSGTLITGVTGGAPWRWWTDDQADTFALYVRWPEHSTGDLRVWWSQRAPF